MKLPKNLISEFVKITNNTTKTKNETTVYGSIVKKEKSIYVKLDGSDILTPVSTTADAQDGERVTVLIKNHTATVTGNISSPAARTDDVQQLEIDKLDAASAEITYATITNLEAANGKITNLESDQDSFKTLTSEKFNAIESKTDEAGKTATDFLSYDSTNGLQVGDKTGGSWSGFRTQTTSSSFNILNAAGSILASYGAKLIELGKNATDTVIKLCGEKGQIEYASDTDSKENYLQLSSDKLRLKSNALISLYSSTVDENGDIKKSSVNVTPDEVHLYSSSSSIIATPSDIKISTQGPLTISSTYTRDGYGKILSSIEGSSGIWRYKKWSSGTVELWGSQNISGAACNTSFGSSLYRSEVISPSSFPFTVYDPILTSSFEGDGYGAFLWSTSTTTTTSPPSYYLVRTTSGTINNGKINFHVIGTWTENG